jgi:hypothetical protein
MSDLLPVLSRGGAKPIPDGASLPPSQPIITIIAHHRGRQSPRLVSSPPRHSTKRPARGSATPKQAHQTLAPNSRVLASFALPAPGPSRPPPREGGGGKAGWRGRKGYATRGHQGPKGGRREGAVRTLGGTRRARRPMDPPPRQLSRPTNPGPIFSFRRFHPLDANKPAAGANFVPLGDGLFAARLPTLGPPQDG